jgi:hypothetical protein
LARKALFPGFVTRHPALNAQEFAYFLPDKWTLRPISYDAQDVAHGRQCEVSGAILRAPAFVTHPALNDAILRAEIERMAEVLKACLGGLAWMKDISSGFYNPGGASFYNPAAPDQYRNQTINAVLPMTQPAGLLCGIIVQDGQEFYVWRKTAKDNKLPDYERENFGGNY